MSIFYYVIYLVGSMNWYIRTMHQAIFYRVIYLMGSMNWYIRAMHQANS